ncbi:hypothetical protein LSTR_LSTR007915 [Laodelphax striatellus]|uniref:DEAD-box helicase OB fold domain-containing protein n=1 Tax=Laodelphax striatellus TaxID=195883 RepID=A0A482XKQ9_LAOST|nr:hypothetical protein LSTR_LSTR007915 [Laodelphax striatellus]
MDKLGERGVKPNEVQMWPVALHSKMDNRDQKRVVEPAPWGIQKVILSTNLAESWIILPDVVFVIDMGLVSGGEIGVGARTEPCSQLCMLDLPSSTVGRAFCDKHRLSEARLKLVYRHRQQLRSAGLVRKDAGTNIRDLNTNSESLSVVEAALTAGHYPKLARVDRKMNALQTRDEVSVTFHPSSLLKDFPRQWVVFEEKMEG